MATFNLEITYPDNQGTRIMNVLKAHWTTQDEQGNDVVPTNQEAIEKLRIAVTNNIRDIVFKTERDAAVKAAAEAVSAVDVT